ncbi:MAG: hypothetical protein AABX66_01000 [Nanoarchaeota archaeon]
MVEFNVTEGKTLYKEGKIEVRYFKNSFDEHNVWIDNTCFLLQRGCLEEFALKTHSARLEQCLRTYDETLPYILRENKISPETFALILARAKISELEVELRDARSEKTS